MNLTGAENAPNIAEITVLDDRVRVALEVYVGDLSIFKALLPDEWLKKDVASRPSLPERLRRFSTETFQIITDDGTKLQANLRLSWLTIDDDLPRMRTDENPNFEALKAAAERGEE